MADQIDIQAVIDRIKNIRGMSSDKELASLLNLAPADFSNRKKRGSLIPMIVDWALQEDVDLNDLFTGIRSERGGTARNENAKPVRTLDNSRGPSRWLSENPIDEIVLSDEVCEGVFLVKMSGSSMEPAIGSGAIFAVDYSVTGFASGQIFVVWIPHEGPVVRRVFIDPEKLILRADNPLYPETIIPFEGLQTDGFILGRVIWVFQSL